MNDVFQLCDHFGIRDEKMRNKFARISKVMELPKGYQLFSVGDFVDNVYVIIDGVVRGYSVTPKGVDITDCLAHEYGQIFVATPTATEQNALMNAETLTPCRLLVFPYELIASSIQTSNEMFTTYNQHIYLEYTRSMKHKNIIQSCVAKERYQWFLKEYPGLIDKIPHSYIASFLSVTPVTLSRIRHGK